MKTTMVSGTDDTSDSSWRAVSTFSAYGIKTTNMSCHWKQDILVSTNANDIKQDIKAKTRSEVCCLHSIRICCLQMMLMWYVISNLHCVLCSKWSQWALTMWSHGSLTVKGRQSFSGRTECLLKYIDDGSNEGAFEACHQEKVSSISLYQCSHKLW